MRHHTAERLERAIDIKMVVGWRIQLTVRLGREVPELPSELLFSDGELRVLATFARSRELPPPERLGEAVGLIARLGGWFGAPATRRTRSSCGTATPSSLPWLSPSSCVTNTVDLTLMTSSARYVGHGQA